MSSQAPSSAGPASALGAAAAMGPATPASAFGQAGPSTPATPFEQASLPTSAMPCDQAGPPSPANTRLKQFQVIVPEEGQAGRPQPVWRLGSVLKFCAGLSRVERSRVWRLGGATINGLPAGAPHLHCRPGDVVEAWYPEPTTSVAPEAAGPHGALRILYEDDWLLAVNKPAGQLSHPARSEQHGTAANAVAARYVNDGTPEPVRIVHRLDRDTSGVLLFARTAAATRALIRQRAAGELARDYLALVAGHPPPTGTIAAALAADPAHRTRRLARLRLPTSEGVFQEHTLRFGPHPAQADTDPRLQPGQAGSAGTDLPRPLQPPPLAPHLVEDLDGIPALAFQEAITTYQVVEYGLMGALVVARLQTGRTHQVRAHLASIGYPLLADDLYGGPEWPGLTRQALHAWRVRLNHPHTGQPFSIIAPLPPDFQDAARRLLR